MSPIRSLLVANRGEVAVRIARAAAGLGILTTIAFSEDEANSPALRAANAAARLPGRGASAYLDGEAMIAAALTHGCDAIHPGYGFLSENADFALACAKAGLRFIGPSPEALRLFGDKAAARKLAIELEVPLLPGVEEAVTLSGAQKFMESLGPGEAIMLKALSGGGGRGMRVVTDRGALGEAFRSCEAEARMAFGSGGLYVEKLVRRARHIEVQIIGDGKGGIVHVGERECTLQRRHQKLIEIAPSPSISDRLRENLCAASCRMAAAAGYSGLCTFEFLIDADAPDNYWFMEANPRLQVEHTITEEVCGIDLVEAQILIAGGASLAELGLDQARIGKPSSMAIQLRISAEIMETGGSVCPSAGKLVRYDMPKGPGIRVDDYAHAGASTNPNFDSLLAKIIITQFGENGLATYSKLLARARRAIGECRIEGVETNQFLLAALLEQGAVRDAEVYTRFVEDRWDDLLAEAARLESEAVGALPTVVHGTAETHSFTAPPGTTAIATPMTGLVARICLSVGDTFEAGDLLVIVEAMKMEHPIHASAAGSVRLAVAAEGSLAQQGEPILLVEYHDGTAAVADTEQALDLDLIPPLLAEEVARRALRMDEARTQAVARRHKSGRQTIRENIAQICDPGSFNEYGGLALPSQRKRRTAEQLIAMGPADGLVAGTASINAASFDHEASRCIVVGYDYMAFAGTQGWANHKKLNRMLHIAAQQPVPLILFAEGGGGRPGETDQMRASGLDSPTFVNFARLSGKTPLVGIATGRCFAGNAALLGCCDVIIATKHANIGMGGPAMIEGAGLGRFAAEEVGPLDVQRKNGVVDIAVRDDVEAIAAARRYVSYFQGNERAWKCDDQRILRHLVPESRRRAYDIRRIISTLADTGSLLELRPDFGRGLVTTLARIEGRAVGIMANDNGQMAGALDSVSSGKGARFLRLCDVFGLPVVSLCDTPGFMVGPKSEESAAVRHMSRLFLAGANISVPMITVVLRNGFGLGAMAMAGGNLHETLLTVAWPTAQFGSMGLEGGVRLGYRKELEALTDQEERLALFNRLVAQAYEDGRPHNAASYVEIDDVIDPAATRQLIVNTLRNRRPRAGGASAAYLDSW